MPLTLNASTHSSTYYHTFADCQTSSGPPNPDSTGVVIRQREWGELSDPSGHASFVDSSSSGSGPLALPIDPHDIELAAALMLEYLPSLSLCPPALAPPPPRPVVAFSPPTPRLRPVVASLPPSPFFLPLPALAPSPAAKPANNAVPPPLSNPSGTSKLCHTGGTESTPHSDHDHEVPVPLGSPTIQKLACRRAARRSGPYPISAAPSTSSSSSHGGTNPSPSPAHSSTSSSTGRLAASPASGLKVSQRRNKQVDPSATPAQGSQSGAGGKAIPQWMRTQKCPHCGADWSTKRRPDFMRHVASHTRDDPEFACAGVPIHLAAAYGLDPVDVMRLVEKGEALLYDGQLMVGGCKYPFSRADALKRHLCNPHISCIGTHTADWLIGNKKKLKRGE